MSARAAEGEADGYGPSFTLLAESAIFIATPPEVTAPVPLNGVKEVLTVIWQAQTPAPNATPKPGTRVVLTVNPARLVGRFTVLVPAPLKDPNEPVSLKTEPPESATSAPSGLRLFETGKRVTPFSPPEFSVSQRGRC